MMLLAWSKYSLIHFYLRFIRTPHSTMTRTSLLFLVLLVWTSHSSPVPEDGMYDDDDAVGLDLDYDTYESDVPVGDDEDSTVSFSEEGKQCLLQLIGDCMTENGENSAACESLATNLENAAAEGNNLEDLCNVPRDPKAATPGDKKAQKDFDKIKGRLYKVLGQLIKAYESRLALKARQIRNKNRQIKRLNAQIKKLKNKLKYSKNKAKEIVRVSTV